MAVKLMFFGDSVTQAGGHDGKTVGLDDRWWARVLWRLKDDCGLEYLPDSYMAAKNGNTVTMGMDRVRDIHDFRPQIMTLQFGLNDCNFWETDGGQRTRTPRVVFLHALTDIVCKALDLGVQRLILMTNYLRYGLHIMPTGREYNELNRAYNAMIRRVWHEMVTPKLLFVDMEEVIPLDKQYFLDEDHRWIHLSAAGNRLYANALYPTLLAAVKEVTK